MVGFRGEVVECSSEVVELASEVVEPPTEVVESPREVVKPAPEMVESDSAYQPSTQFHQKISLLSNPKSAIL